VTTVLVTHQGYPFVRFRGRNAKKRAADLGKKMWREGKKNVTGLVEHENGTTEPLFSSQFPWSLE